MNGWAPMASESGRWPDSRSLLAMSVAGLLASMLLLVATGSTIGHPPTYDELLHVLAAKGVLASGEPVILDGIYGRAELFTRLVAWMFDRCGANLHAARLPALISAVVLVFLTGAWVTRQAGFMAGVVAAVLLATTATTLELAVFARFYSLHAVIVLVFFVAVFQAASKRVHGWPAWSIWFLLVVASVLLAWHLQSTTLIAVGAASVGAAALFLADHWNAVKAELGRRRGRYALGAAVLIAAIVLLAFGPGIFMEARTAPLWAARRSADIGFYSQRLGAEWPLFWPLFPLAAIATVAAFGRFGLFCVVLVITTIALHSLAAAKSMRYLYYALPLACAIVGCGVSASARLLASSMTRSPRLDRPGRAIFASILLLAVVAANSQEARVAGRFLSGRASWTELRMFASESNWDAALPFLRERIGAGTTIIVSSGVKGAYYLEDYDYELNASTVLESETGEEFGLDLRTGRLVIGSRDSLKRVLSDSDSALVVVDDDKLGRPYGVSRDVATLIELSCTPLRIPAQSRVHAWTCGHP